MASELFLECDATESQQGTYRTLHLIKLTSNTKYFEYEYQVSEYRTSTPGVPKKTLVLAGNNL